MTRAMSERRHQRTCPRRFRPLISWSRRSAAKRTAGSDTEELFRGRRHRRGMMVGHEPILVALGVREAVARRQARWVLFGTFRCAFPDIERDQFRRFVVRLC